MDRGKDETELEEELAKLRGGNHPEWRDEKAGDNAEGANPEAEERRS